MSEGAGSGLLSGMQGMQSMQMNELAMQGERQNIEKNALAIQATRDSLQKQAIMMQRLQDVNHHSATDPAGQARSLSSVMMDYAEAAFGAGLPEQGAEYGEKAGKLLENTAKMDEQVAKTNLERATTGGNLADWVLSAKDDTEAQARWQKSLMLFQNMYGMQSPYAKQPFSRQMVEGIRAQTKTVADQEKVKLTQAQTEKEKAEAVAAGARGRLDTQKIETEKARKAALEKAGGKGTTKAEQKQVDALQDLVHDVDDLISQLDAHPDMTMTGLGGRFNSVKESISGALGGQGPAPEHEFQTTVAAIRAKLPRAMTGASRSSKEEQAITAQIADLMAPGITGPIGKEKAQKVKELLKAQIDKAGVRPSEESKVLTFEEYLAAHSEGGE